MLLNLILNRLDRALECTLESHQNPACKEVTNCDSSESTLGLYSMAQWPGLGAKRLEKLEPCIRLARLLDRDGSRAGGTVSEGSFGGLQNLGGVRCRVKASTTGSVQRSSTFPGKNAAERMDPMPQST